MICDLQDAFASVGLKLNASKCKVQTNGRLPRNESHLVVDDVRMPYGDASEGFDVLGTRFTLKGGVSTELE